MKTKSILSVCHTLYGSHRKVEKKYIKAALLMFIVLNISSVFARTTTSTRTPVRNVRTTRPQPARPVQSSTGGAPVQSTSGQPVDQSTNEGWRIVTELMMAPAPWTPDVQAKYDQYMREGKLSVEQQTALYKAYEEKKAMANRWGYQQSQYQWGYQPQQAPVTSFAPSQALAGVKTAGAQAAEQAKSYYDWMKDKAYNMFAGSYVSGLGASKYIAPAVLGLAAGPVGLIAGATAALATGGSGLAIWGLSNIMDRANFMALSGGHGTTESWLNTLKGQIQFILNNKAAYPYYLSKQDALRSNEELYEAVNDTTGVIKQAHDAIAAEQQAKLNAMQPGGPEFLSEQQFVKNATEIRNNNNYWNSTPEQYIATLKANNDLIKAEALVSEYNRALNRISVREAAAKKQMAAQQAQAVAQQQAAQQQAGQTTTESSTTAK